MKTVVLLMVSLTAGAAYTQTTQTATEEHTVVTHIQQVPQTVLARAAQFVASTHDSMLDPASFVVDEVIIAKNHVYESRGWRGRGKVIGDSYNVCVSYRAHNQMGGYSSGFATLEAKKDEPSLYVMTEVHPRLGVASFDVARGPQTVCKNTIADVTAQVAPAAERLYTKSH